MAKSADVNLDSFLDIMTCLVGVLVLIIILTGLDAAQIRVLIPTPMEYDTAKRPIFIEARNNQLYLIPLEELRQMADDTIRRISSESRGDLPRLLRLMNESDVRTEQYYIDLTYFMVGQFGIRPVENTTGYALKDWQRETQRDWFGSIIHGMNKDEEFLAFLIRDDSFDVFKIARHLAWVSQIDVAYELLSTNDPLLFGMMGLRARPQ